MTTGRARCAEIVSGDEADLLARIISDLRLEHEKITGAILALERFERLVTKTGSAAGGRTVVRTTRKPGRRRLNQQGPQQTGSA
jgi:hypothetical protein